MSYLGCHQPGFSLNLPFFVTGKGTACQEIGAVTTRGGTTNDLSGLGIYLFFLLLVLVAIWVLAKHIRGRTLELRLVLDKLKNSEALFRNSIEFLPIPIGIANTQGQILLVNQKFTEHYGYTLADLPSIEAWFTVAYPDPAYCEQVRVIWDADAAQAVKAGATTPIREYRVTCKNGQVRDVEIAMRPEGQLWIASFNDITNRRQVEEALRENEMIFSSFLEHSPVYVFFKDKNIRSLRLSKNYEQMLGMAVEAALGKTMDEIFPSDLAKSMVADDLRILNEGQRVDVVEELNGHIYETTKFPIYKDGEPHLLAGFTLDITERKRNEEIIRENEKRFRTLIEHSADALTLLGRDGTVIYEGPTVQDLTGYLPEERVGMNSLTNIFPDDLILVRKSLGDVISAPGKSVTAVFRSIKKDGSIWWTEGTATNLLHDPSVQAIVVNYRDITRRKLAEDRLRESEQRYRTLFERANDAIFVENSEDQIVDVNHRACEMLGYTREEMLQLRIADIIAPELGRRIRTIEQEFAQYDSKPFESVDIRKDGTRILVEVTNTILPNGLLLSIVRDITERKQAEAELRSSEKRFRILFENAGVGVAQGNSVTRRFIRVNQKFADIVGYTRQEMEDLDFATITYPDDLQNNIDLLEKLKRGEISEFTIEKRYIHKDGSLIWVMLTVSPMWNPGETPDTHITVAFDITEQKRAQEALRESEHRFRTLFESAGVGVAQAETKTGRLLRVNQRYCEIVGYSRVELESITYQAITYPDDLENDQRQMDKLIAGEISEFQIEKRYIRKDGTLVWVALVVSPLWQPGESPSTHIGAIHDITEQKRAEYALRYSEAEVRKLNAELERRVTERTSQLEAANKELEAFAYSVSHDLRAPLRAIDGFSRILLAEHGEQLNADALELLDRVRSANQNMTQLVDALLGLSRMTRTEIRRETLDLSLLARKVIENLRHTNPDRQVEFSIVGQVEAEGDLRLLSIVLENLIGNAWKFTSKREQAQVEFGVEQRDGGKVYFVRDNGAGFNMAYADKLFGAFQRLHTSSQFEGTGIGLATIQRIIHRHGGRVWAEAEVDKGATFYFTLG